MPRDKIFPVGPVTKIRVSAVSAPAPGPYESGVARGLLQGGPLQLPMGWGVGEELTKS